MKAEFFAEWLDQANPKALLIAIIIRNRNLVKKPLKMWRLFTKFLKKRSRRYHKFQILRFFHLALNLNSLTQLQNCEFQNCNQITRLESNLTQKAYFRALKSYTKHRKLLRQAFTTRRLHTFFNAF